MTGILQPSLLHLTLCQVSQETGTGVAILIFAVSSGKAILGHPMAISSMLFYGIVISQEARHILLADHGKQLSGSSAHGQVVADNVGFGYNIPWHRHVQANRQSVVSQLFQI